MKLKFVSREQYRAKNTDEFITSLHEEWGDFYCLPEGGSNVLALKGVAEVVDEIDIDFDVITCACGTGATLAGLTVGLKSNQKAKGFAALKSADFLISDVAHLLHESETKPVGQFDIETGYHFGGYAKMTAELSDFIIQFKNDFGITLDGVYTGKMFYGLFDKIKKRMFEPGAKIIALHTGGLQGNAGLKALHNL